MGLPYNQKADVFSYGVVLFEILTRQKSSNFGRIAEEAFCIRKEVLDPLIQKDAPPELVQLAYDCCQYEADDRPEFTEIVERLDSMEKAMPKTLPRVSSIIVKEPEVGVKSFHIDPKKVAIPAYLQKKKGGSGFVHEVDFKTLTTLGFSNPPSLVEALKNLRLPSTLSGWVLLGYSQTNVLCFQKEGKGTPEELMNHFDDAQVQYALIRIPVPKDDIAQKVSWDVFVSWVGPKVSLITKGKAKSNLGQVMALLRVKISLFVFQLFIQPPLF